MTSEQNTTQPPKKQHPNLFKKSIHGGLWTIALRIVVQAISFIRYIIIVNVLQIEDIGLLGVAMLLMQILDTFSNTGFRSALIQKKSDIEPYLNVTWTTSIIRALILYAITFTAAPLAASLKVPPEKLASTIQIIRVIGLLFVIRSLANVATTYFQRDMLFKKLFKLNTIATVSDVIVTVTAVLIYRSVWAIVAGKLVSGTMRCVLTYIVHPYRPRLDFDLKKAAQLWTFGKWITLATIIGFLLRQGDDLFVWGYLGIGALGLYQVAYKLANISTTEITGLITGVAFTAYSKIQDDKPRIAQAYLKKLQIVSFLALPVTAMLLVMIPDFATLFLKPHLHSIVPAVQVFAMFGLVRIFGTTMGPVFNAIGKPKMNTLAMSAKLVIAAAIIWPLTRDHGITGTAMAMFISGQLIQPLVIYILVKELKIRPCDMFRQVAWFLAAAIIMAASAIGMNHYLSFIPAAIKFFTVICISTSIYLIICLLVGHLTSCNIKKTIKEMTSTLIK